MATSDVDVSFPPDNEEVSKGDMRAQMLIIYNELTQLLESTSIVGQNARSEYLDDVGVRGVIRRYGQVSTFAEIYVTGGATAQSSIGTSYVQVTGYATDGPSKGATPNVASEQIDIIHTGFYRVHFDISFSGSASTEFTFSVHVNDAEPTRVIGAIRTIGTGGDSGSCGASGILELTAGDDVSLYVKADGASKSITPIEAHLFVERV